MIYPKFLEEKNSIGITAASDGVSEEKKIYRLDSAIKNFNEKGFEIVETQNVRTSIQGRSSTSILQAKQLEELILEDNVGAIICACGGDFLLEMLSEVDFNLIQNNPKWLQGYSDFTALLFIVTTNLDIATIYSDNFTAFGMNPWHQSLENNLKILKGKILIQNSFEKYEKERQDYLVGDESYNLSEKVYWKNLKNEKEIVIKGRMIGGCIDILTELFGTRFDKTKEFIEKYKNDGIIWYFDNCELSSEQLIRTLWKFRDNGWFQHTNGIIFGRSMCEKSYYEISLQEAILHSLGKLNIPIIMDADIGHVSPRMTIINGAMATITSNNGKGMIEFTLK